MTFSFENICKLHFLFIAICFYKENYDFDNPLLSKNDLKNKDLCKYLTLVLKRYDCTVRLS